MYENAKVHILNNRKWYGVALALIVLLFMVSTGYKMGYRLTSDFNVGKVGNLAMVMPLSNTNIFIDQSKKITGTKENEEINLSFSPTKHSIIISRDGYFPWKKDFEIKSNETLKLSPLFVTQNATGQIITKIDPEYWNIRNKVVTASIPEKNSPLLSEDKSTSIWLEDNAIMAKIGDKLIRVVQPDTIIRNLDFYKDRSDVIMFSTSGSVFIIEIGDEGNQNFMPVYRGQKPIFLKTSSNFIYVFDADILMEVVT